MVCQYREAVMQSGAVRRRGDTVRCGGAPNSGGARSGTANSGSGAVATQPLIIVRNQFRYSLFLIATLFLSCQTAPKISNPLLDEGGLIPLEPGAFAYIIADVQKARPFFDFIPIAETDDAQIKQIIDKTTTAVAGVYPADSGRQYQAAGWGNYPAGRGGLAFGMSKGWKKQRSPAGYPYWHSSANRLSVAMSAGQIYASASRTDSPADPFGSGLSFPDAFNDFRRSGPVACWLEDPGPLLAQVFETIGLPLQIPAERIFILFSPVMDDGEARYEALIRMETSSASQARGIAAMIALARMFASGLSGGGLAALMPVLFANPPAQDGANLTITTAPLGKEEIAALFALFQ